LTKNTNKQDRQAQRIVSHRVDLQFTQYHNQRCTTYNHRQTVNQGVATTGTVHRCSQYSRRRCDDRYTGIDYRTVEQSEHTIDGRRATRPRRQTNSPVHAAEVTSTDHTTATTGRVVR